MNDKFTSHYFMMFQNKINRLGANLVKLDVIALTDDFDTDLGK